MEDKLQHSLMTTFMHAYSFLDFGQQEHSLEQVWLCPESKTKDWENVQSMLELDWK